MGLDMTLLRKTYIKGENYNITVERNESEGSHVNPKRIFYIVEEIHYWRKANQIHNWFVNNLPEGVENCYPNHVERCNLEQLLQECKRVLENKELAEEMMEIEHRQEVLVSILKDIASEYPQVRDEIMRRLSLFAKDNEVITVVHDIQ